MRQRPARVINDCSMTADTERDRFAKFAEIGGPHRTNRKSVLKRPDHVKDVFPVRGLHHRAESDFARDRQRLEAVELLSGDRIGTRRGGRSERQRHLSGIPVCYADVPKAQIIENTDHRFRLGPDLGRVEQEVERGHEIAVVPFQGRRKVARQQQVALMYLVQFTFQYFRVRPRLKKQQWRHRQEKKQRQQKISEFHVSKCLGQVLSQGILYAETLNSKQKQHSEK